MKLPTNMRAAGALLMLICLMPTVADAAGYAIAEQSAPATGMVGAFTAKADDASAIYYNAAGIARLRGLHAYVGGMFILGRPSVSGTPSFPLPGEVNGDYTSVFIPNVYVSYGFAHNVAVGVGLFTNFGLKVDWPADWVGRFLSTHSSLEDVTINPTVAWSPFPWFSIGAGLDITPARAELRRAEDLVTSEAELRFRANATGIGGNVGVLFQTPRWRKLPPFSIGLQYRSRYNFDFNDGGLQITAPLEFSGVLHDSKASAKLPAPDLISLGVGVRPIDPLFLQVQFDWADWSRFQTLTLTAQDNPQLNVSLPQNWRDGYILRIGGEYAFERWSARLGVGFDWAPVPESTLSPVIPDANRVLGSAGFSVGLPRGVGIDFGLMGVFFLPRTSTLPEFPVDYSNWALLFSLGVSYNSVGTASMR